MNYTIEEIYQNIEVSERRFIIHPDTGFSLPDTITATNCTYTYDSETGEVIITEATGDIVITANMVGDTFNIAYNLTNVSGVGTLPTTVTYGSQITITFEADSGYRMPSTVNVSGCSYSWQQSSGQYWELSLLEFTGNVTITIEGIRAYTITKTASHALIQGADTIDAGDYSLYNIVPDNGYYLPDTMFVNGFTVGSTTVDLGNSKARYEKQDDEWAILYLSDVNENITCSIGAIAYYTITTTITNATLNSVYIGGVLTTPPYKIKHGRSVMLNLTANTGYEWVSGNYSCMMGGSSAGQFTVNGSSLQCYIQTVTGNITLMATATSTVYSYTLANTLSNISVDGVEVNDVSVGSIPSTVLSTDVVEMIFTCVSGYEIPSSITVNGVTVGVGLGDVSANGCTANYMAFQSTTNRCFIVLKNFTANTSFSVTAQSTPVGYVIPAGTYYGKNNPTFPLDGVYISCTFVISNTQYSDIDFNPYESSITYMSFRDMSVAFQNGSWVNNLRTITVTSNTTVTQTQYEAFFNCYDRVITDLTGTVWQFNSVCNYIGDGTVNHEFLINYTSDYFEDELEATVIRCPYVASFMASVMFEGGVFYLKITDSIYTFWELTDGEGWYKEDNVGTLIKQSTPPTIEITGGTDATNATLISWLQANATQMPTATQIIQPTDPLPDPNDENAP